MAGGGDCDAAVVADGLDKQVVCGPGRIERSGGGGDNLPGGGDDKSDSDSDGGKPSSEGRSG